MSQDIYDVFNRNIGNKMTEELATGMASAIIQQFNQQIQNVSTHFTAQIEDLRSRLEAAEMAASVTDMPDEHRVFEELEHEPVDAGAPPEADIHVSSEDIAADLPEPAKGKRSR